MLLSMTGFGSGKGSYQDKTISIELKSLNSKFTDIRLKLPQNYKQKEPDIRKMISGRSQRGKVEVNIEINSLSGDGDFGLNRALFSKYYKELKSLSDELNFTSGDYMQAILRMPNVVASESDTVKEEEWDAFKGVLGQALDNFVEFRSTEGQAMADDCIMRLKTIDDLLDKVDPFEKERVEKLRKRMLQNMDEYVGKENIDANRFEQEILYYLEKIDITEEKVRLSQHCKYFNEVMAQKDPQKGRKLGFIAQEMGREINTLGSKANSSDLQKIVVRMKDELEKIKEQVANIV